MKNAPHWKKLYENKKGKSAEVMPIGSIDGECSDSSTKDTVFISDDNRGIQAG